MTNRSSHVDQGMTANASVWPHPREGGEEGAGADAGGWADYGVGMEHTYGGMPGGIESCGESLSHGVVADAYNVVARTGAFQHCDVTDAKTLGETLAMPGRVVVIQLECAPTHEGGSIHDLKGKSTSSDYDQFCPEPSCRELASH